MRLESFCKCGGDELFSFKTVEEKAAEWGVTARHVQHLCRDGKLDGAVKRGGVWFIPNETPSPQQNTKPGTKPFRFVGTKKRIFDNAIRLFTSKGYENVSMQDIAEAAGIRQSAVYNHFKSKQEILDTIYDFYSHHCLLNRPTTEAVEKLLVSESLFDIITKGFIYEFDKDTLEQLSGIVRIVLQRSMTDEQATALFLKYNLQEGIDFVETSLNRAVEIGRIAPTDTHIISVLINCIRIYMLLWWMINPPKKDHLRILEDEQIMYRIITSLMTDKKPPGT